MTLSEMIKKYERVKAEIEAESGSRPTGKIVIINAIIKDLHSVKAYPSVTVLRDKILKQIDKTILNDDPDGALTWANVLSMLPKDSFPYAG